MGELLCEQSFIHVHLWQRSNGKSPDDSHCLHYTGPFGEVRMVLEHVYVCVRVCVCMCAMSVCVV